MGKVKRGMIRFSRSKMRGVALVIGLSIICASAFAQNGSGGIQAANDQVRSYFGDGEKLMYGIGGLVGLIGAIKVYQKWNAGDPDTSKVASAWFGSCIFLVVVATIIKAFFGV